MPDLNKQNFSFQFNSIPFIHKYMECKKLNTFEIVKCLIKCTLKTKVCNNKIEYFFFVTNIQHPIDFEFSRY